MAPKRTKEKKQKAHKEGRITRYKRQVRQIHRDPKSIGTMVRDGLLGVWHARGGGFYGLGYLITFIWLEVQLIVGDVTESDGVVDFVSSQAVEFIFRFGIQSFLNGFLAFLWPIYVVDWLGAAWGIGLLVGGYLIFEKGLRPVIEGWLPEMAAEKGTDPEDLTKQDDE